MTLFALYFQMLIHSYFRNSHAELLQTLRGMMGKQLRWSCDGAHELNLWVCGETLWVHWWLLSLEWLARFSQTLLCYVVGSVCLLVFLQDCTETSRWSSIKRNFHFRYHCMNTWWPFVTELRRVLGILLVSVADLHVFCVIECSYFCRYLELPMLLFQMRVMLIQLTCREIPSV